MAGKPKASKSKRNSILFKMVSTAGTGYYYLARRNPKQKTEKIAENKNSISNIERSSIKINT